MSTFIGYIQLNEYKDDKKLEEKIKDNKSIENTSGNSLESSESKKTENAETNANKNASNDGTTVVNNDKKSNNSNNRTVVQDSKKGDSGKTTSPSSGNSNTTTTRPAEKPSNPSADKPTQKKDVVEYKNESESYGINFKTVDNYASSGGESRVYQDGRNGVGEKVYKVKYVNGVRQGRELVSDNTVTAPQNKIVQRYVKVQDEKWETREIEDKNKPIYEEKWADRWFVKNNETGEITYYYSMQEAFDAYGDLSTKALCSWGDADPEMVGRDLIGYEKTTQNIKVQDAKYEWKH